MAAENKNTKRESEKFYISLYLEVYESREQIGVERRGKTAIRREIFRQPVAKGQNFQQILVQVFAEWDEPGWEVRLCREKRKSKNFLNFLNSKIWC